MKNEVLTLEAVKRVAHLSRLSLNDAQLKAAQTSLQGIMVPIAKLLELDVDEVSVLSSPLEETGSNREDLVIGGLSVDEALRMAPERLGDGFGVPKIIE